MSTPENIALGQSGSNAIDTYYNLIQNNINAQTSYLNNINLKNQDIMAKQQIQIDQLKEIEEKEKLLLTRSRMLQIAQDRNSYKKKIIYSLLAVIFFIFIIILASYVLYSRKNSLSQKLL
jgi:hypothetical protein